MSGQICFFDRKKQMELNKTMKFGIRIYYILYFKKSWFFCVLKFQNVDHFGKFLKTLLPILILPNYDLLSKLLSILLRTHNVIYTRISTIIIYTFFNFYNSISLCF